MSSRRRFEKMYNTYADEIYRYCLSHSSDSDLSEDIVSETFMKAWKHFDTFDNKHPRAWLYTIAKNLFRDHWRKKPTYELDEQMESDKESDNPVLVTEKNITIERVQKAIAALPAEMKDVVYMRCILGLSAKQVAGSLNITEANVRVLQHRGLKKLKDLL